jgi:hypothetical protein
MRLLLATPLVLALGGCFWSADGFDNYDVRVVNHTDEEIVVLYNAGTAADGLEWSSGRETHIGPRSAAYIGVKDVHWDADISVLYRGFLRTYDVDPDFWGQDTIDVFADHFPRGIPN